MDPQACRSTQAGEATFTRGIPWALRPRPSGSWPDRTSLSTTLRYTHLAESAWDAAVARGDTGENGWTERREVGEISLVCGGADENRTLCSMFPKPHAKRDLALHWLGTMGECRSRSAPPDAPQFRPFPPAHGTIDGGAADAPLRRHRRPAVRSGPLDPRRALHRWLHADLSDSRRAERRWHVGCSSQLA